MNAHNKQSKYAQRYRDWQNSKWGIKPQAVIKDGHVIKYKKVETFPKTKTFLVNGKLKTFSITEDGKIGELISEVKYG